MTSPFNVSYIEPVKLAKMELEYFVSRYLSPSDFPPEHDITVYNYDDELIKLGYPHILRAHRPYFKLHYQNYDGSLYYEPEDVDKKNPYALVRFLGEPMGWKGTELPPKVIAQNNRANVLHYEQIRTPDGTVLPWASLKPGTPVLHVESLVKAKAVHKATIIPCIGLNGVNSYSSAKRGVKFLYENQPIDFTQFFNIVLLDSNAIGNKDVALAREKMLSHFKHTLGCEQVGYIDLPKREDGTDRGPDDYLMEEGAEKLNELLKSVKMYQGEEHADLVNRMNDVAVFCTQSGLIIGKDDKVVRKPSQARDFYANVIKKVVGKGGKVTTVKGFDEWLASTRRYEVINPTFEYLGPPEIEREDGVYYNLYHPGGAWPDGSEGDEAALIISHLYRTMGDKTELVRGYLKYLKYTNGKPTSFAVLYSDERGAGKSWFNNLIEMLLGVVNTFQGSQETFLTKFNPEIQGKRAILINEVKVKGGEKDRVMNNVKTFIADKKSRIEGKGKDAYSIESSSGIVMNANALEDVPNDGMKDRRIWYVPVEMPLGTGATDAENDAYWTPLWKALDDRAAMRAFAAWVKEGEDINFATWRPPMDDVRRDAILASLDPVGRAAYELLMEFREKCFVVCNLATIRGKLVQSIPNLGMSDQSLVAAIMRDGVGWKTSGRKYGKNGEQKKVWIVNEGEFEKIEYDSKLVERAIEASALGKF